MTTTAITDSQNFDITPDPRVLQMLGEIDLQQWRCIAELVDNSVDGFLNAERSGAAIENPEVLISGAKIRHAGGADHSARQRSRHVGDTLEHAVKAGWTGNSPLVNLGLFGMGFNIATARLGLVTEVWTSRAGEPVEVGVRIDFDELRAQRTFKVPRHTRTKVDHTAHGTEIVISKLKPDQRQWFARAANVTAVRKQLAKAYSALLSPESGPAIFRLELNGTRIQARRHCVWSPDRSVETPNGTSTPWSASTWRCRLDATARLAWRPFRRNRSAAPRAARPATSLRLSAAYGAGWAFSAICTIRTMDWI